MSKAPEPLKIDKPLLPGMFYLIKSGEKYRVVSRESLPRLGLTGSWTVISEFLK